MSENELETETVQNSEVVAGEVEAESFDLTAT